MRSLIYYIATSLDGYIATPEGGVEDFLMEGPHADEFVSSLSGFDSVIMGANTYRFGFQYGLEPGQPAYPGLVHHVFSRTLTFDDSDDVILETGDVAERVRELRREPGNDIWICGGGVLAGTLVEAGQIDELWLKINPIVLGDGIRLFNGKGVRRTMHLSETKPYPNGVVLMKYRLGQA